MNKILVIAIFGFQFACIFAQDVGLREVVDSAIKHHSQGKIKRSQIKELRSEINLLRSRYYPKVSGIIGNERRQSKSSDPVNTSRFVAELRLKYDVLEFSKVGHLIQALNDKIKIREVGYQEWENQVTWEVANAYYQASYLSHSLKNIRLERRFNTKLQKNALRRRKKGLVGKSDTIDLEIREQLLAQRELELSEDYQSQLTLLKRLSYMDDSIKLFVFSGHSHRQFNLSQILNLAKEQNKKILKSRYEISKSESELNSKGFIPKLSFIGRVGKMRLDEQYSNNSIEGLAGVYLEIPLFDGGKHRSVQEIYEQKKQQAFLRHKGVERGLESLVNNQFLKIRSLHRQVDLSEKLLVSSEKYFSSIYGEYKRGMKNSLDLISARDRLLNNEIDLLNFKKKYALTILGLDKLLGKKLTEEL